MEVSLFCERVFCCKVLSIELTCCHCVLLLEFDWRLFNIFLFWQGNWDATFSLTNSRRYVLGGSETTFLPFGMRLRKT